MTSTIEPITLDENELYDQAKEYHAYRREMIRSTPDEKVLQFWLLHVLGIWLPHRRVCDGHIAPYEYFCDTYYERVLDSILWAARMCGKSFMAGLMCWMKGRDQQRPYWQANICAGSGAQAARVYEAADLFWTRTDDIGGRVVLKQEPLKGKTEFLDGSMYEITASSPTAQRGPHPNAVFADEIDEIKPSVFSAVMNQTMERHRHKPTQALLSTMHKIGGIMSNYVDTAQERGFKLYVSCVLESLEACTGDYNCETCNLDKYCERKLKVICAEEEKWQLEKGIISSGEKPFIGFNTIETIRQKVRQGYEKEEDTGRIKPIDIDAELFCKRPSRTGLVFPDFNDKFHVVPAQEIKIQSEWKKGRATDFGFSAPFVDLYFAITPRDQIIFYYELVKPGMTMPDIIAHLKEGRKHTRFLATFGDPAGATEIETIRQAGIPITPVVREIHEGITAMTHLLRQNIDGQPQFIISSACAVFIDEMRKLSYPENGLSEKPVKKDDHCVEAASRAVIAWIRGWLQPIDSLIHEAQLGGQNRNARETSTDTAFRETKAAERKHKTTRRRRVDEQRESALRHHDYH